MSERKEWQDIIQGIGLSLFLNIAFFLGCGLLGSLLSPIPGLGFLGSFFSLAIIGIGLSQLLYVIPIVISLKRQEKWGEMKGLIIGAVITFLLSGGCWLILLSYFNK
jgi:Na+/proline symporter